MTTFRSSSLKLRRCVMSFQLLVAVSLITLSTSQAAAQLESGRENSGPLRRANSADNQPDRQNVGPTTPLKFPKAVQVNRPISVMPPKPGLVAPKDEKISAGLADFDKQRTSLVKQVVDARSRQDNTSVARLVAELDRLRVQRLEYLRPVAERIRPAAPPPAIPVPGITEGPATSRPVLPIPELPPRRVEK